MLYSNATHDAFCNMYLNRRPNQAILAPEKPPIKGKPLWKKITEDKRSSVHQINNYHQKLLSTSRTREQMQTKYVSGQKAFKITWDWIFLLSSSTYSSSTHLSDDGYACSALTAASCWSRWQIFSCSSLFSKHWKQHNITAKLCLGKKIS